MTDTSPSDHSQKFSTTEILNLVSKEQLKKSCYDMNAELLTNQLTQIYTGLKEAQDPKEPVAVTMPLQTELCSHLKNLEDPCTFIINCLEAFTIYRTRPKYLRNLVNILCGALSTCIFILCNKRNQLEEKEKDRESMMLDERDTSAEKEINDSSSGSTPFELSNEIGISHDHQSKLVDMIDTIVFPDILFYALDTFKLNKLIGLKYEREEDGVKLVWRLVRGGYTAQAIGTIKKLNLLPRFTIRDFAFEVFSVDQKANLSQLVSGDLLLQQELLEFINAQLSLFFAASLEIAPFEKLCDAEKDNIKKLPGLMDKNFRKILTTSGIKLIKATKIKSSEFYYVKLSQCYSSLRYYIIMRDEQQKREQNWSVENNSNYNGIIDRICQGDQALAKLTIKTLVDLNDIRGASYFATRYNVEDYLLKYQSLLPENISSGTIVGDQKVNAQSVMRLSIDNNIPYYQMPSHVHCVFVNSKESIMFMKESLCQSHVCGIDTEWAPEFTSLGDPTQIDLIQISSDVKDCVFLLDLTTILASSNNELEYLVADSLKLLFESNDILKIVYGFTEDRKLLHQTINSSNSWKVKNLLDFNSLTSPPTQKSANGEPIKGGLAAVVKSYLHSILNKKQQMSNWAQRPLTEDQITYAACDAYCLLQIYEIICKLDHPFLKGLSNKGSQK